MASCLMYLALLAVPAAEGFGLAAPSLALRGAAGSSRAIASNAQRGRGVHSNTNRRTIQLLLCWLMFFGVHALTQHYARMSCPLEHAHSARRAAHASLEQQRGDRAVPQPAERQRGGSRAGQVAAPPRALRGRVRVCIVGWTRAA